MSTASSSGSGNGNSYNGSSGSQNDEEMARRLQQEFDDTELARRYEEEELAALDAPTRTTSHASSELSRDIDDMSGIQTDVGSAPSLCSDEELARKMQTLEHRGLGRVNSIKNPDSVNSSLTYRPTRSDFDNNNNIMQLESPQQQERQFSNNLSDYSPSLISPIPDISSMGREIPRILPLDSNTGQVRSPTAPPAENPFRSSADSSVVETNGRDGIFEGGNDEFSELVRRQQCLDDERMAMDIYEQLLREPAPNCSSSIADVTARDPSLPAHQTLPRHLQPQPSPAPTFGNRSTGENGQNHGNQRNMSTVVPFSPSRDAENENGSIIPSVRTGIRRPLDPPPSMMSTTATVIAPPTATAFNSVSHGLGVNNNTTSIINTVKQKGSRITNLFGRRNHNSNSNGRPPSQLPTATPAARQVPTPSSSHNSNKKAPICDVCKKVALSYLVALDRKYHPDCFRCMGCHELIDPSVPFAFSTSKDNERYPLHRKCYSELFGVKCVVCFESIPSGDDGKISYVKHPFFDGETMCPSHANDDPPNRRCSGCHRFEPQGAASCFADIGDANRCLCFACCKTVVVDNDDAKPLWSEIIQFFEHHLKLPVWGAMRDIPVLVVGHETLNEQMKDEDDNYISSHGNGMAGSGQIMTRGLCLSEHQAGRRLPLNSFRFDPQNRSFSQKSSVTFFRIPDASKTNPDSSVTAILCLSGLPADLTASILAHEATHAWFKLHPEYNIRRPIPLKEEEGCCQLISHMFLNYRGPSQQSGEGETAGTAVSTNSLSDASTAAAPNNPPEAINKDGPSAADLRDYFKFSIESDTNEIYGDGFRQAKHLAENIGIETLLSHIVLYKQFPTI